MESSDQFAVMVDGPWGAGKTYFIKNTVIPTIRLQHKVIYFSVYGYESLSKLKVDLINNLFIASLGKGLDDTDSRSKISDIASLTKGVMNLVGDKLAPFKALTDTAEKIVINKQLLEQGQDSSSVLIIDDLERISRKFHTSDLLGFLLTDIIENYGYRVIVVGNTQEIREDEANEFKLTREKAVSRIFPFSYDLENIQNEFFLNSDIEFLRDNSEWLIGIFAEFANRDDKQLNLRTLEFILNTFSMVDNSLNRYLATHPNEKMYRTQIERSVFANLFVIANEYREGNLNRESLRSIDALFDTREFFFPHLRAEDQISAAEKIAKKYHDDNNLHKVIMYDDSVNDAIFNGIFDARIFVKEWLKLFKSYNKISSVGKLATFREMTDEELGQLEVQLLKDSQSDESTTDNILTTINYFVFFDKNDLYFAEEEYLPILLESLKKTEERYLFENKKLLDRDLIGFKYSVLVEDKDVLKQVKGILDSVETEQHELNAERLLSAVFEQNYKTMQDINHSDIRVNIFRALLDSKYLTSDVLTMHSKASLLDRYLISNYVQTANVKEFHKGEESDVSKLIDRIGNFIAESTQAGQIDKFNLNGLLATLKQIQIKLND